MESVNKLSPPFVKTENISWALRRFLNPQLADNSRCLLYVRQGPSTRRNHFLQIQETLIKAATNNQFGEKIFLRSGRAQNIFTFFLWNKTISTVEAHLYTTLVGQKLFFLFLILLHLGPVTSSGKNSWKDSISMHRCLLDSGGWIMLHLQTMFWPRVKGLKDDRCYHKKFPLWRFWVLSILLFTKSDRCMCRVYVWCGACGCLPPLANGAAALQPV